MVRSTGLPRQKGIMGITRVIRARVTPTTINRVTQTKGSLDETTTSTTEHTEDMWLFEPQESVANEQVGERVNGALGGLVIAEEGVDLEKDDRIVHGGVEYEIDAIVGHPQDDETDGTTSSDADFWIVDFTRRQ